MVLTEHLPKVVNDHVSLVHLLFANMLVPCSFLENKLSQSRLEKNM